MRRIGRGLIGVLLAADWLLQAIGGTAFSAVVWIVLGLVLPAQVAGLLAKMGVFRLWCIPQVRADRPNRLVVVDGPDDWRSPIVSGGETGTP